MEIKPIFEMPKVEIIFFANEDVIITSPPFNTGKDELPLA